MKKKVFVWVAHPRRDSYCAALAASYVVGAETRGAEVRRMDLADMRFDSDVDVDAPLEDDLLAWQRALEWCDHFMIVHPTWWGAMPNRAKAVFDRALTSGFAYKYTGNGFDWDKLLEGRSADAIITADTPTYLDTLLYLKSARRALKNQILDFVGFNVGKVAQFGSVKASTAEKRHGWLADAEQMGRRAVA